MTKRTLVMDVPVGETVHIDGGRVVVQVKEKSGQRVRLAFTADSGTEIKRPAVSNGARAAALGTRLVPST